jgi:arsenate reductase
MAEGLLKDRLGDRFQIDSAGTRPIGVSPEAIAALDEIGIDISENRSKSVDEFTGQEIDYVLTVCDNAKANCPYFPAKTKLIHHAFEDPYFAAGDFEARVEAFRKVRDKIAEYIDTELRGELAGT